MVVLPAPFGPMIDRISPALTVSVTRETARIPPNWTERSRTSSVLALTSSSGVGGAGPHAPGSRPSWDGLHGAVLVGRPSAGDRQPAPRETEGEAAEESLRAEEDQPQQDRPVDHHPVLREEPEYLGCHR